MGYPVDTILVPQGVEHQAVQKGLRQGGCFHPQVVTIPVGPNLLRQFLTQALKTGAVSPSGVLLLGLCGSLTRCQRVGGVVVYDRCIDQTQGSKQLLQPCDPVLTQWARQRLHNSRPVVALTSDRVIHRAREKQQLAHVYGAEVVDMEGFAALQVLREAQIPMAMVRVVSDDCDHDLPDLSAAFDAKGQLQPLPLALQFLRHPLAAARLVRGSLRGLRVLEQVTTQLFDGI
jgi:nucleoside phosphorylase